MIASRSSMSPENGSVQGAPDAAAGPLPSIRAEVLSGVLTLTLDRPERRNALGEAGMAALADALRRAESDPGVGAVLLTGAPPAFCAGSDLKELGALSVEGMRGHEAATAAVVRSFSTFGKPIVAAVEGYALGGGFILAAACDVVVTTARARWHLPEARNGWLPPWGLAALVARTGVVRARLLTWGAESIDGVEAHCLGVADELAEDGQALGRARLLAEALARLPAEARASVKRFYAGLMPADAERLDALASDLFAEDCRSAAAVATLQRFTVKA